MSARRKDIGYSVDIYSQSIYITRAPGSLYQAAGGTLVISRCRSEFQRDIPPSWKNCPPFRNFRAVACNFEGVRTGREVLTLRSRKSVCHFLRFPRDIFRKQTRRKITFANNANAISHPLSEVIRITETGQLLLIEFGILRFGIRNSAQGLGNPNTIGIWNPSCTELQKSGIQDLETGIHSVESRIQDRENR